MQTVSKAATSIHVVSKSAAVAKIQKWNAPSQAWNFKAPSKASSAASTESQGPRPPREPPPREIIQAQQSKPDWQKAKPADNRVMAEWKAPEGSEKVTEVKTAEGTWKWREHKQQRHGFKQAGKLTPAWLDKGGQK